MIVMLISRSTLKKMIIQIFDSRQTDLSNTDVHDLSNSEDREIFQTVIIVV